MVAQQTFSRLFPRPKEFLPERWLRGTDLSQQIPSYGYLPFGHGRRKCIGNRIATMNMQILLIKLLQSYKISYNYEPIETINLVVNLPSQPLKFQLEKRA